MYLIFTPGGKLVLVVKQLKIFLYISTHKEQGVLDASLRCPTIIYLRVTNC